MDLSNSSKSRKLAPWLSCVFICYREERIPVLLNALRYFSSDASTECVIVTNMADEVSASIFEQHEGFGNVRVMSFEGGASAARNIGLSQANGVMTALFDDDMLPQEGWIEEARRIEQLVPNGVITGPITPVSTSSIPGVSQLWVYGCRRVTCSTVGRIESAYGGNLLLIGEARKLRFDERLGPRPGHFVMLEDADFVHRAAASGIYLGAAPGLRVLHYISPTRLTLAAFFSRARDTGYAGALYQRFARREGRLSPSRRYLDVLRAIITGQESPYVAPTDKRLRDLTWSAFAAVAWAWGYARGRLAPYPRWL